jgi:hypothetical protein
MQHATWIGLLHLIPRERHDALVVVTTIGIEITLQAIFRIEPEYVVVRGRLAGSLEAGRVFFLPYDQINFLGFHKEMTEAQIQALYGVPVAGAADGSETPAAPAEEAAPPAAVPLEPSPTPSQLAAQQTPPPDPTRAPIRSPLLGKTRLIERLRARGQPGAPAKPADK